MTVAQLLEEYIQLHALHHWSVGTLRENQQRIDDYIVPYIGDQKIKDLTTHGLESFYQMLLTVPAVKLKGRESEDRTVSPYVVSKCHTILRSALNQALRWDYLRGNNPAMAVELPKNKQTSGTRNGKNNLRFDNLQFTIYLLFSNLTIYFLLSHGLSPSFLMRMVRGKV